jgi:GDP-mannose 6-dehydrogenase
MKVRVYDADIQDLSTMLGSNREYLERQLPQVHWVFRTDMAEVINECDAIILTQHRPEFEAAIQELAADKPLLDLVTWQTHNLPNVSVPLAA